MPVTRMVIDYPIKKAWWWTQNRRGSWKAKWQRTRMVHKLAYIQSRNIANGNPQDYKTVQAWQPVHVTATVRPLTHGRFDPENAAPVVKAIIDGMTQAGWWIDDDSTHLIGPDYRAGAPSDDGNYHIIITLTEHHEAGEEP